MNKNEIMSKIYDRILEKLSDWYSDLPVDEDEFYDFDEDEYLNALDVLSNALGWAEEIDNKLTNLLSRFDEMGLEEIYEEWKDIFRDLFFSRDEIDELMPLVKKLWRDCLKELLRDLKEEFDILVDDLKSRYKEAEDLGYYWEL